MKGFRNHSDSIPVIDLFAGPGGLGEGFSSFSSATGRRPFGIRLSIESNAVAHATLQLRSFYRQFDVECVPDEYYDVLRSQSTVEELYDAYPDQGAKAALEAWNATLGATPRSEINARITAALNGKDPWVLVGGPPCQAYSVAGRSRNNGVNGYRAEADHRQYLYVEYLQVIADHWPAVFVMENVKGLLSASLNDQRLFQFILDDLELPREALKREGREIGNRRNHRYRILSLASEGSSDVGRVDDYVVLAERHGIPQARHRVILVGVREDFDALVIAGLPQVAEIPSHKVIDDLPRVRSGISRGSDSADAWEEFRQEVLSRCNEEESDHFREDKFTEVMIEYLTQANEIDEGEVCYHKHNARSEKLNGFSLSGDGECADLFVSCYHGTVPPDSVPNSEINTHFRWLRRFFEAALSGAYRNMEESSPVFDAAQQIYSARDDLSKARFFLLTDGIARNVDVAPAAVGGVEIRHYLWDIEKLRRFITSRMQREAIEIDFVNGFGGAVPCLEAPDNGAEYRTFLTFFPGSLLANLYGEFGPRLLEKNVRSFLQAKGKINKGIRKTILDEPHRFLAYNNGISATAEKIELEQPPVGVHRLKWARDFQIVNGGQTTASIYHALRRDKASLADLTVQVKLTVLSDPRTVEVFVPLISQYANSQNKVNAADFSANHPYHIALEELSRRLWAPPASGTERQTHWFYERARGSYLDDKGREGTPARMRAFEALNPLRQKFTKTDLAKYENTWDQYPYLVCLGAEKNFIKFTALLVDKGYPAVDDDYFHRLVAKAIMFRTAEKLVGAQGYGGFRAQIVAYTLAWLSHNSAQRIDLERIWKEQTLSEALCDAITGVSKHANEHIVNPPPNRRNPGEWCKREECWEEFRGKDMSIPRALEAELVDTNRPSVSRRVVTAAEALVHDPEVARNISRVMEVHAETWFRISRWAKETDNLLPWQRGLAFSLGKLIGNNKPPSPKQAVQGLKILEEATRRGFKSEP